MRAKVPEKISRALRPFSAPVEEAGGLGGAGLWKFQRDIAVDPQLFRIHNADLRRLFPKPFT
ncbi:hypothetical protein [Ancylobacter sp. FA202]|uniref:hypothetical protein n=1 Tax=Ancylobacter sp. FA202 TaxID=1111106 RepID=UPI0012DBDE14|nr:hypothetical protein [Ancylobacter sp. FA202]